MSPDVSTAVPELWRSGVRRLLGVWLAGFLVSEPHVVFFTISRMADPVD